MEGTGGVDEKQCCAAHPHLDTTAVLLNSYLFADLTPAELHPVIAGARMRHYEPGQPVFSAGDRAEDLFVLADGQLRERLITPDGDEAVTELLTTGATFGEPGLFAPERDRIVDVVADRHAHVVQIPRELFLDVLRQQPLVAIRLAEGLSTEVRWLTHKLTHAGYLPIRARLVTTLIDLANTHGTATTDGARIEVELTHADLARMIFATRENVARAMGELTGTGAVTIRGRQYYLDVATLSELSKTDPPLSRRNYWQPPA